MDLYGFNDLSKRPVFYRGVVEDNQDPLKLGRLKVRILGSDDDDIKNKPTDTLPWAEVATPTSFGFSSGIGVSSVILKGTYVWLFLDNGNIEKPVVFATCAGVSNSKETGAFTDPDGVYPIQDRLKESDYNRLARGEKVPETESENLLNQNRIIATTTSVGGVWNEPESLNQKAQYPRNNVIETSSYHVIQVDDTPGNERIHIFHRTGSYIEIRPDGDVIIHGVKDKYELQHNDQNTRIQGNKNITIDRNHTKLICGQEDYLIQKDVNHNYNSNFNLNVKSNETHNVGGKCDYIVKGVHTIKGSTIYLN